MPRVELVLNEVRRIVRPHLPARIRRAVRTRLLLRNTGVAHILVTDVRWTGDDALELSGTHPGGRGRLVLRHRDTGREHVFPLTVSGRRFSVRIPVAALPVFGAELPLPRGRWQLLRCSWTGADLPAARVVGGHRCELVVRGRAGLALRVRQDKVSDAAVYPALRRRPMREAVLFESMHGRSLSCNPRAVFEEIRRRDLPVECVWSSADGQFAVPDGTGVVLRNSPEYFEALARSRWIVSNNRLPHWFDKRPGQRYLQCWHGTPLKTLGFDITALANARGRAFENMRLDVPRWDLLLSPNPFTTEIMRRAYRYDGPVLESGYPRNDLLNAPDRAVHAARIRARLGLPPGRQVILYAPTWRDDLVLGRGGRRAYDLALDLDRMRRALGSTHVLLLRAHHNMGTGRGWRRADSFVVDASAYPDIAELFLVADVLVTDYSSAMFDFAVTGRPMVFFTYDLERYRDEVRGFYFDLAAEAPGPLVRTTGALIEALHTLDQDTHKQAYQDFAARYCPYDDGYAASRVVDHFFGEIAC